MRALLSHSPAPSENIVRQVIQWLRDHPALRTVSLFSPLPGEPDLTPLVLSLPHIRWVFPRVEGPHLVMHPVGDISSDLEPGAFGIREPKTTLPSVPFGEIDAFLCPGLAFSAAGGRLGRGKGFYDRMLSLARPDAHKIGVCQPFQIVPDTFSEPHDILMSRIISG